MNNEYDLVITLEGIDVQELPVEDIEVFDVSEYQDSVVDVDGWFWS
jgi:hypothetical protein